MSKRWVVGAVLLTTFALACSEPAAGDATAPAAPEFEMGELRKAAAAAGKSLGTAVNDAALSQDAQYRTLLAQEFDSVTPENAMKWGSLMPTAGTYNWQPADAIVDFAVQHGQSVKGHTFVWHTQLPAWVNSALGAEELGAALKLHIETTAARYKGRVRAWDVVNEAVNVDSGSGYTESIFWQKLGPDYIEQAFRWARAADPDALLYYNEVGIERSGPKSDFTYALMQDLLGKGTPIDGIGFQSHVSIHRYPAESNLRANIARFAALGLEVNISELDARTTLLPADQPARWEAQRIAFQEVVGACVVEPGCTGVTFWGFSDQYSWLNDEGADEPLLFDRSYQRKPAYQGALAGLQGRLPTLGENVLESAGASGWTAQGGMLTMAAAVERNGTASCVSARATEQDGLASFDLSQSLALGGPIALSAWVRVNGAESAIVQAALSVTELVAGADSTTELSLGAVTATNAGWAELAGYAGLGFASAPSAITLKLYGPPVGVDLCATEVRLAKLN